MIPRNQGARVARSGLRAWIQFLALGTAFLGLLAWTWGTWPDVLVDFGRELYAAWQIAQGKRLYADLAWFNGPLSVHANALLFRIFGPSLTTLVWANAAVLATVIALLHYLIRSIASRGAATAACLAVLALHGFGQLAGIGNYNFICPYAHEVTHGVLLGFAALGALRRWRGRGGTRWVALSGLCVGLAFLTKPETFLAAAAGAGTSLLLHARREGRPLPAVAGAFLAGGVAPVVASVALLAAVIPAGLAWQGTLGSWPVLLSTQVSGLPFFQAGMGLDSPVASTLAVLGWGAAGILLLIPAAAAARWARLPGRGRRAGTFAFLFTLGALLASDSQLLWSRAARAWPLFALAALVSGLFRFRKHPGMDAPTDAVAFAVFSLALLGKILLNTRLGHYGFALAMPATALVVAALLAWIPERLRALGWSPAAFRAGAAALLLGFCGIHLRITSGFLDLKAFPVGAGSDRFRADPRGRYVNAALEWLQERVPAGTPRPTLAVLPEGAMINYLARLEAPTPYVNLMPPLLLFSGEARVLDAFRARPPDVLLLVHKSTAEFGAPWFGRDYGREIQRWIEANYRLEMLTGDPPLQPGSRFGIAILVRRDPTF